MITLTAEIVVPNEENIIINHRNSLSIERTISDRSDFKFPSFGIISNSGNIKFIDSDKRINALIKRRAIQNEMEVNFYLSNTITKARSNVGNFFTKQWKYDNYNLQVNASLQDNLQKWQEILFSPITYSPHNNKNRTGEEIYRYIYSLTPTHFNMLDFDALDEDTKIHLKNCKFEYWVLKATTLWSAWTYFCNAFQTHIYKNAQAQTVCKYNGGN